MYLKNPSDVRVHKPHTCGGAFVRKLREGGHMFQAFISKFLRTFFLKALGIGFSWVPLFSYGSLRGDENFYYKIGLELNKQCTDPTLYHSLSFREHVTLTLALTVTSLAANNLLHPTVRKGTKLTEQELISKAFTSVLIGFCDFHSNDHPNADGPIREKTLYLSPENNEHIKNLIPPPDHPCHQENTDCQFSSFGVDEFLTHCFSYFQERRKDFTSYPRHADERLRLPPQP